jgi:hypothetical protein
MKSHQLTLGRGGAAKVVEFFCHLCPLQSEYIAICNEMPCDLVTCSSLGTGRCHYHDLLDDDKAACALQKLSVLASRLENGLLMHLCKERMIRNLKMKEDIEIKAKKRRKNVHNLSGNKNTDHL